ncbi:MAG: hypothetical protein Q7R87_02455 [Nanoarchaeota archaeon]|nr:hypothetical protein [Nanoarchaeota archaeon]
MEGELVYVAKNCKGYTVYESLPAGLVEVARIHHIERDGIHTIVSDAMDNRVSGLIRDIDASIVGNVIGEVQLERKMREVAINIGIRKANSRKCSLLIGSVNEKEQASDLNYPNMKKKFEYLPPTYFSNPLI